MSKYLNLSGLNTFWDKIKSFIAVGATGNTPSASKTIVGYADNAIEYGDIAIAQSQVAGLTGDLANKIEKVSGATDNDIVVLSAVGGAADSGMHIDATKAIYDDGSATYQGTLEITKASNVTSMAVDNGTAHDAGSLAVAPTSDGTVLKYNSTNGIHFATPPSGATGATGDDGDAGQNGTPLTASWSGDSLVVSSGSGTSSAVNLKGATGTTGDNGPAGNDGSNGVMLTTSWSGSTLSVTSGSGTTSANLKGAKGATGATGATGNTGTNGTPLTTSWSGSTLSVTSGSGTTSADLKGAKGATGDTGANGNPLTTSWDGTTLIVTSNSGSTITNLKGAKGATGDTGANGTPLTVSWDSSKYYATITSKSGTSSNVYVRGDTGTTGNKGTNATLALPTVSFASIVNPTVDVGGTDTNRTHTIKFPLNLKGATGATGATGYVYSELSHIWGDGTECLAEYAPTTSWKTNVWSSSGSASGPMLVRCRAFQTSISDTILDVRINITRSSGSPTSESHTLNMFLPKRRSATEYFYASVFFTFICDTSNATYTLDVKKNNSSPGAGSTFLYVSTMKIKI